jgi:hypothetical protein
MKEKYSFIEKLTLLLEPELDPMELVFQVVVLGGFFHLPGSNCVRSFDGSITFTSYKLPQLRENNSCLECLMGEEYILNTMVNTELSDAISGYRHLEFMLSYWDYDTFHKDIMGGAGIKEINNIDQLEKAFACWDDFFSEVEYGLHSSPGLRVVRSDELFTDMYNKVIENMNSFQAKFFSAIINEDWFINHFKVLAKMEKITSAQISQEKVWVVLGPFNSGISKREIYLSKQADLLLNVFAYYINWQREFVEIPRWVYEILLVLKPGVIQSVPYDSLDNQILETAKVLWDRNPMNVFYSFDSCVQAANKV